MPEHRYRLLVGGVVPAHLARELLSLLSGSGDKSTSGGVEWLNDEARDASGSQSLGERGWVLKRQEGGHGDAGVQSSFSEARHRREPPGVRGTVRFKSLLDRS